MPRVVTLIKCKSTRVAVTHSEGRSLLAVELMAFMWDLQPQNPFRPVGHQETLNQLLGLSNCDNYGQN
jgi:hypothetical protein